MRLIVTRQTMHHGYQRIGESELVIMKNKGGDVEMELRRKAFLTSKDGGEVPEQWVEEYKFIMDRKDVPEILEELSR